MGPVLRHAARQTRGVYVAGVVQSAVLAALIRRINGAFIEQLREHGRGLIMKRMTLLTPRNRLIADNPQLCHTLIWQKTRFQEVHHE